MHCPGKGTGVCVCDVDQMGEGRSVLTSRCATVYTVLEEMFCDKYVFDEKHLNLLICCVFNRFHLSLLVLWFTAIWFVHCVIFVPVFY